MSDYSLNAKISYRQDLNDELMIIRVSPLSGEVPDFTPGQYAELALPDPQDLAENKKIPRRSLSIASAPSEKNYLEFYVVLVPNGYLTPKLWKLKVGDKIWLGPKVKGKFSLDPVPPTSNLIMLSTGTGLAPYVSMLRHFKGQKRWNSFTLFHGVRYERDLGYRAELEELAKTTDNFFYIPSCTRETNESWRGETGRINTLLEKNVYQEITDIPLDPANCQVFLCGNPEMIDSTNLLLESKGFKPYSKKTADGNIHFERYW
jgi:ferredoxin/flavodoxin---NADP+ reductase